MKSLEIVNLYLEELELHECKEMWLYRISMQQIKSDLEVLEIIRKKRVNVGDLAHVFRVCDADGEVLDFYNAYIKDETRKLTLEELLKLKQWLEENENELGN